MIGRFRTDPKSAVAFGGLLPASGPRVRGETAAGNGDTMRVHE